jgi:hypothetical protein
MCKTTDKLHPFESAGLGKAPFKFVGFYRDIGPKPMGDGMTTIGAPGQPMGTCDYCLNGIANCYQIASADGKHFVVGCDCVDKLCNPTNLPASRLAHDKVYQAVKAAQRKATNEARQLREKAKIAEGQKWADENEQLLRATQNGFRPGESLWDQYVWFMNNAGNAGKIKILKQLKRNVGQ